MADGSGTGRVLARMFRGLGQTLTAVLGIVLLAAASGVLVLTQTATGRRSAATFLEETLEGVMDGTVQLGPITGGNLLTRAELARFRIVGPEGGTFLELRDVRLAYSPLGLVRGRYHLRSLRAASMELRLEQELDGSWNFDRIFGGEEAEPDTAGTDDGPSLWITDAGVGDGRVVVRTAWEPEAATAAEADSLVRAALAGESLWRFERTEGGIDRVITLEGLRGRLPYLRLLDPRRPMHIEFERVRALARVVTQELEIERFDGAATFGDTIRVGIDALRTAHTSLSGEGWVSPEDPPRYRFDLDAGRLGFEDLRWLPVPVPDSGGGPAGLVVRTAADPEVVAVDVREASVRAGASRADGGFSLYLEETPLLSQVDLDLQPLELGLVADLLDRDTMPDGLVRGRVRGAGPIDLFEVDADVTLRPERGDDRPSALTARGGIGLVGEPRRMRALRLGFDDFDLRWTRVVGIDTRQPGRITGEATLDRAAEGRIGFEADVRHVPPEASESHLVASGSFEPGDPPVVALNLRADPLSLSLVDPYFPALDLVGSVTGPASLSGSLSDLTARADLATPRGQIQFDGSFDLTAERKTYDARLTAREIQLRQWFREGPDTRLDVRGDVRGEGTDPATLEASFDLAILPSTFAGARIDSSLLRFSVGDGLARIDTFAIRSDVGTVRGRGGFGLTADRSASLFLDLDVPELSAANRWIVPGRVPTPEDTTARDLFAEFPVDEERREEVAPDTLAGTLAARGVLYGNVESFGAGGRLEARRARYGELGADSIRVTVEAPDARSLESVVVAGTGWGVARDPIRADSATFRLARGADGRSDVRIRAARGEDAALQARGEVVWSDSTKRASVAELSLVMGDQRFSLGGPARLSYGADGLAVSELALRGAEGAHLRVDGTLPRSGPADLQVSADGVSLDAVRQFLALEEEFGGELEARLDVGGTASQPRMSGSLAVDRPSVRGHSFGRMSARFDYAERVLSGEGALQTPEGAPLVRLRGSLRANLAPWATGPRLAERPLDATVTADSLPLAVPLLPVSSLRDVAGVTTGEVRVRGGPEDFSLDGGLRVTGGAASVPALGIRIERLRGAASFAGTEARLDSLRFASAKGGSASVSGTVGLADPTDPALGLDVEARELRGIDTRKYSLVVDGSGRLEGSYRRPDLTGRFRLSDGTVRVREFMSGAQVVDLTDPEITGLIDTTVLAERRVLEQARNPFLQNLRAEVDLLLGPDLWLRSPDLNVEIGGDVELRMDRARSDVRLYGDVRLVRGTYRWTGARGLVSRNLRIEEGRIEFVGTPGVNPNLEITAVHRIRTGRVGTLAVRAHVSGTMLDPSLALTSEPPMSESDRVCVLLLNSPCAAPGAGQLARDQLLGRISSELSSALAGEVGADFLEVRSTGRRTSVAGDEADGPERSLFSETEVEAGWYLSPELFLTVTYPFGRPFPEGTLDWRFTDQWSLELLTELRFEQGFRSSATSNLERDRTWGLFLFREWSF